MRCGSYQDAANGLNLDTSSNGRSGGYSLHLLTLVIPLPTAKYSSRPPTTSSVDWPGYYSWYLDLNAAGRRVAVLCGVEEQMLAVAARTLRLPVSAKDDTSQYARFWSALLLGESSTRSSYGYPQWFLPLQFLAVPLLSTI